MISAYHRPRDLDEALKLISRDSPRTVPLGGGTMLSHERDGEVEVVDLQALDLNRIVERGQSLEIGGVTTLREFEEFAGTPAALASAIKLEKPLNLRNMSTIAGSLVVCDGRSALAATLLALDATLTILRPRQESLPLGEFLPMRGQGGASYIITKLGIPLTPRVAFEYVARTPADHPIVGAALARWPSGRIRLVLCGYGPLPRLAMDGNAADDVQAAARNAFSNAMDAWGSAEYRMETAAVLSRRCLDQLPS
jgi:carbon-monoxide dehydrogenase medium subunit